MFNMKSKIHYLLYSISFIMWDSYRGKKIFFHLFFFPQGADIIPLTNTVSACLFQRFCVMENSTSTYKRSLCPWLSATSTWWSPPSPSQSTEVLSRRHGSRSSRYPGTLRASVSVPTLWLYLQSSVVLAYGGPFPRCLFLYRNIANSLPNVALPKVPSLPLNLPQIPSFSTPPWMASLYESTCVSLTYFLVSC